MILWNAPASWSAWQWLIIIFSIKFGGIPFYFKTSEAKGGGSTMTPFLLIHKTNPEVDSPTSKPCEFPNIVIPKAGGSKKIFSSKFNF